MDITYLDYAATTPVDQRVAEAMSPFAADQFGNPSALHRIGRMASAQLEAARAEVSELIGANDPEEVVFTSGGTESDNAAIIGIASAVARTSGRRHLVISAFEHHAVLEPVTFLESNGFEVTYVSPRRDGYIHSSDVAAALRDDTVLVSVMHGNNEIGTVSPIAQIARDAHAIGALVHTDAAQTLGKVPFDVQDMGVDAASFSAHKIYGPKGIGALFLRDACPFDSFMRGGGQEFGRRSGTQNVAGAVGLATALRLMLESQEPESRRLSDLRRALTEALVSRLEGVRTSVADAGERIPGIASLLFMGLEGEALALQLDAKGFAVSAASACSSGSSSPSHVLTSMGIEPEEAIGSLRVSLGRFTTEDDVLRLVDALPPIVERIRSLSSE